MLPDNYVKLALFDEVEKWAENDKLDNHSFLLLCNFAKELHTTRDEFVQALLKKLKALQAENARLRSALQQCGQAHLSESNTSNTASAAAKR